MEVRLSAHGAYQHQYHVVWIPKYRRRILRGAIKIFVEEQVPQIQDYHPDVEVQQWSVQIDHIHLVLVIPPKYAVSSIVGKMKANLSRQLRLRYPELKRTYWGAVLWSPGFFSSTVGLNEAVIRRYVEHQERVDKGQIQLILIQGGVYAHSSHSYCVPLQQLSAHPVPDHSSCASGTD